MVLTEFEGIGTYVNGFGSAQASAHILAGAEGLHGHLQHGLRHENQPGAQGYHHHRQHMHRHHIHDDDDDYDHHHRHHHHHHH
eukprot:3414332-Karenia_brevis.AAC.1